MTQHASARFAAALALVVLTGMAAAQVAAPNTLAQPSRPSTGVGTSAVTPPPARPAPISATPAQRGAAASPIQSGGPAKTPSMAAPIRSVAPVAPMQPVRDAQGRTIPGALRTSPNRAIDPATGRPFQTMSPTPVPTR